MDVSFKKHIDAREYLPKDKHRIIFETFESLEPGTKMELINDHNPKPLFYQFKIERAGTFTWEYIEEGPEVWRVAIGKV